MSVFGLERSYTNAADVYDHAISLVDSTKSNVKAKENIDEPAGPSAVSRSASGIGLERQWTKVHLRKQLARRKYAKWQEEKEPDVCPAEIGSEESGPEDSQKRPQENETGRTGRLRDKVPFRTKKNPLRHKHEQDTFIDVLYENQRGSFFCGIPLYSSNSLLNFDPAGWQNSTFQDSPVNITNAQPPDPTWQWAWRTWYVDMSYDVDEEGWQYSFTFGKGFAWHGNQPWFHSFVRRRRWLRKRARIYPHRLHGKKGDQKNAHLLTPDYFTIHAGRRDQSRGSSDDRSTINRSSFVGAYNTTSDSDEEIGEIEDIAALMVALKKSRVDREKIAAVKAFLNQGGDELFYLADAMPTIMEDFVHQTSRRQLQTFLLQALDEVTRDRQDDDDEDKNKAKRRRTDNLLKAVHAAGVHTNDVGFWSDLRTRATGSEVDPTNETHALDAAETVNVADGDPHAHIDEQSGQVKEQIKGIPDGAQISEEPKICFDTANGNSTEHGSEKTLDKGKGKA